MAWGDAIFEVEQIEKLPLIAFLLTHHDPPPPLNESSSRESCRAENHEPFSTASTRTGHAEGLYLCWRTFVVSRAVSMNRFTTALMERCRRVAIFTGQFEFGRSMGSIFKPKRSA